MTVIEIKPHRWGWKTFEASGVAPVFLDQEQTIDYAKSRACFRFGKIRVLDSTGKLERTIASAKRIEDCDSQYAGRYCLAAIGWQPPGALSLAYFLDCQG